MNKYVAYYRVSKDSHEAGKSKSKGLGLEAQENIANHFLKDSIVEKFTETKSAKNITDRPELQKAIQYCLDNDCWLFVSKLDRLSRNVDDVRSILKQLDGNISFGDIPSDGKADIFTITIYAAFAERERTLISLRTKQALKVKKDRNELPMTKTPKWETQQKTWIESGNLQKLGKEAIKQKAIDNANNTRAAQLIISKRSEGMPFNKIALLLNDNKFTASSGGKFTSTQVIRLFKRYTQKQAA